MRARRRSGEPGPERRQRFPSGASISVETLRGQPYATLAALRADEPVSWVPAVGAWLVTRRDLAVEVLHDPGRFTVDDPRFSTTAVLGRSMLSMDGDEHAHHRRAFASAFRPSVVRGEAGDVVAARAAALVDGLVADGRVELCSALAAPLAVDTITSFLGLEASRAEVLAWYRHLAEAIDEVSAGRPIPAPGRQAIGDLRAAIEAVLDRPGAGTLLQRVRDDATIAAEDVPSAAAVIMFGAIETSEGMTANALWHLLGHPDVLDRVSADRSLLPSAIEESVRLEPAASVVDRYTTDAVELGGTAIPPGELVRVSLLAANRDPAEFEAPDRFELDRPNVGRHLSFVQGPHACLGVHLARAETRAAIGALLDRCPSLTLDRDASTEPSGLIFRKPAAVTATWDLA